MLHRWYSDIRKMISESDPVVSVVVSLLRRIPWPRISSLSVSPLGPLLHRATDLYETLAHSILLTVLRTVIFSSFMFRTYTIQHIHPSSRVIAPEPRFFAATG